MQENQEKYDENLKVLCQTKELQNLNKKWNQQLKRLIAEKDQQTQTILNAQSTNNELEHQLTSLKRVNLELETTVHSLEKLQIRRKPDSARSNQENTNQTLDLNDNNIRNTKQFEPVPQNKERLCGACGSEKHEIKDCESKRNIYITNVKRNQTIEHKLRKELEKYGEVQSTRVRQGDHGRKGHIGITSFATEFKQN